MDDNLRSKLITPPGGSWHPDFECHPEDNEVVRVVAKVNDLTIRSGWCTGKGTATHNWNNALAQLRAATVRDMEARKKRKVIEAESNKIRRLIRSEIIRVKAMKDRRSKKAKTK